MRKKDGGCNHAGFAWDTGICIMDENEDRYLLNTHVLTDRPQR